MEKGDATLKEASNKHMDVSGKEEIMVQEDLGLLHKIKVLISKDLGNDEPVVGLEDLKDMGIRVAESKEPRNPVPNLFALFCFHGV